MLRARVTRLCRKPAGPGSRIAQQSGQLITGQLVRCASEDEHTDVEEFQLGIFLQKAEIFQKGKSSDAARIFSNVGNSWGHIRIFQRWKFDPLSVGIPHLLKR